MFLGNMDKGQATDLQKMVINKMVDYVDLTHKTVADTSKKWNN